MVIGNLRLLDRFFTGKGYNNFTMFMNDFMFKKVNFRVFLLIFSVLVHNLGHAHPGRTDANGGHYNRKTGEYHKHVKEGAQSTDTDTDLVVSQDTLTSDAEYAELKLAAWNIRIMSDKSRTDAELQAIARILIDYDFIAIVELRDEMVLKRTQKILMQMGKAYQYQLSPAVGRGVKERYAFLYKEDLVSVISQGELYPDAADGKDDFSRDPYWATFRAGEFDFSVITVHVIWGDTVGPRKAEVRALADVYRYVQEVNGAEEDVLLVGDFNRNPNDAESYSQIMAIPSMIRLFELPQKSHIRDSSLYDNIFFQMDAVTEYLDRSGIDKFDETDFGNDDKAANLAVSDHRPVWAVFSIDRDDDGSDEDGSASVLEQTSESADIHDVNGDGVINILDLVAVANGFGKTEPDINDDGIVNIRDLVIIARELGN
jgi:endonuclease/exonuclease/phosphatase family metal-dependent hydrolase